MCPKHCLRRLGSFLSQKGDFYWGKNCSLEGFPEVGLDEGWLGSEKCRRAAAEALESCGPGSTRLPEQGTLLLLAVQSTLDSQ